MRQPQLCERASREITNRLSAFSTRPLSAYWAGVSK